MINILCFSGKYRKLTGFASCFCAIAKLTAQIPSGNAITNSQGFSCSPFLCYRSVSTTLTAQIPAETLSQSHRLCFMLLHYHYVITSLTMQIPAETLSQTHRVCFTQRQGFPILERGITIRIF